MLSFLFLFVVVRVCVLGLSVRLAERMARGKLCEGSFLSAFWVSFSGLYGVVRSVKA